VTYNLSVSYKFENQTPTWLANTRIRLSVANLTDEPPPLTSGAFGYDAGVSQALLSGRSWSFEVAKTF
jgi:outer membrane receptor protein involved in Fe transport